MSPTFATFYVGDVPLELLEKMKGEPLYDIDNETVLGFITSVEFNGAKSTATVTFSGKFKIPLYTKQ